MQNMKPVQYAQVSYFAHFSRHYFLNFEITDIFIFFLSFFWGEGGGGGEDFVSEIV